MRDTLLSYGLTSWLGELKLISTPESYIFVLSVSGLIGLGADRGMTVCVKDEGATSTPG